MFEALLRKEKITIDDTLAVKQEQHLSELRMTVMNILINLVDEDAATVKSLKEVISKDIQKFQSEISAEIMRVLMLDRTGQVRHASSV